MRYYAIADLHGRYDLLEKALDIIIDDYDKADNEFKIITLGDYIDRGSASNKIIQSLMDCTDMDNQFICLKGNHEDMAVQTITKPLMTSWWFGNGGDKTLESYGSRWPYSLAFVPQEHVKWMGSLPIFYETEKHVFVHGGVPADDLDLIDQDTETMMWMLYGKNDSGGYRGKHVVHGHHQFADGPHTWEGRTNLDTFAWKTGRLVIGVFDDTQHKALRFIEVLGDDYGDQRQGVGS